jgi:hypothetical protein
VRKQLEASELSKVDVVTTPDSFDLVVDAYPDDHLRTPTTVWLHAGRHELRFTRPSDGKVFTRVVDVKRRTHVPLVLALGEPAPKPPKDGHADFRDEAPEVEQVGTPPPVKHPPLMPCKYTGTCPSAGGALVDPLETHPETVRDALDMRVRLGVRVGIGASTGATRGGYALGAIGTFALSSRFAAVARADFVQRLGAMMTTLDAVALSGGIAARVATTRTFALVLGADVRGEARFEQMFGGQPVERLGLAGDAVLDVVLRRVPLVVGARVAQDATPLVGGQRSTAAFVELALELR